MELIQAAIAQNFSRIRKNRGLSLDKIAEMTGVSKAMLAQIENGKSNPTVTTLWKIANGLQVSFSAFIKEPDKPKIEKVNIQDVKSIVDDDDQYNVYTLYPFHPEKRFEVFMAELKPGMEHRSEAHMGEEYLMIQEGQLTIDIDGEQIHINRNESLKFDANTPHIYINDTEEDVRFYSIIAYPESE
ncbi:helix-turn-helix domain-containing protein [Paenibacillus sp. SC116]|uniref:helix-turn-helix domain-containing protein n=1 Tax=Paenibacillus sp. SC116 TaxID=2968986 RepID=UPI00215A5969|nr:helix-turn-helix domain-containing protein [Paenibacillus sp. SC116]MCR8842669.1 helix-turn-helix domain-containing protein [Paenibacillus sp. SC116]